jgi:hypothetical protein
MKIIDRSKRLFECDDGETITVNVLCKGTTQLVTFTRDGSKEGKVNPGESLIFRLDKKDADPSKLTMGFGFSGSDGGAYRVTISGSSGGEPFIDIYLQDFVPILFDRYTFDIWP